jgi:hypothetical protein
MDKNAPLLSKLDQACALIDETTHNLPENSTILILLQKEIERIKTYKEILIHDY